MKFANLILYFILLSNLAFCQKGFLPKYNWKENRSLFKLTGNEISNQEYILSQHKEYNFDWENGNLIMYLTDHKITKVVSNNAIERHNRIYIPMNNVIDIVQLKARSISKDGKVTFFDNKNLKEIKDDNTDNTYKIFAIEGVEPESEIEYFYTLKVKGKTVDTYFFQYETPIKDFEFKLTCPKELIFEFKIYNDAAIVRKDTLAGQNIYSFNVSAIKGLHEEEFALLNPNRKRVEVKLAYNFSFSASRLNTWADAAKTFYKSLATIDKNAEKQLDKFVKTLNDNPALDYAMRIQNIEDKLKQYIRINDNSDDSDLDDLVKILQSRQASSHGMTKLFLLSYEKLDIPVQLVVTSDREIATFDPGFDSWNFLDEYLLFFPVTNNFLVPYEYDLRYPLIPTKLFNQKGLFIESITVSNIKTAIPWIKEIPATPYEYDLDNLDIKVEFDKDLASINLKHKRTFIGYDAAYSHYFYESLSESQKQQYVTDLIKTTVPDIKLDTWDVKSSKTSLLQKMEIDITCKTNHFNERAGNKIVFKVGELIGPQSELYNKETRSLPIDNQVNRGYIRRIEVTIPKGYNFSNLESLNSMVECKIEGRTPFVFKSKYQLLGSQLIIDIEEYYKELSAPVERYEDFRRVINAAADFNKVNIILQKNSN